MFQCCSKGCPYANDVRRVLARHRAEYRHNCTRVASKPSKRSVAILTVQLEDSFETLAWLSMKTQFNRDDNGNIDSLENSNNSEVPDYVFSDSRCRLNLCTILFSSEVEALVSVFWQESCVLSSFRKHVFSIVDCKLITNGVVQHNIMKARLQAVKVHSDKNV